LREKTYRGGIYSKFTWTTSPLVELENQELQGGEKLLTWTTWTAPLEGLKILPFKGGTFRKKFFGYVDNMDINLLLIKN